MAKVSSHRIKVGCEFEEGKDAESLSLSSFSPDPNNSVESDDDHDDDNICRIKPKKNQTQEARFLYSFADNKEDGCDHATYAQPLIRCVWTGTFDVLCDESIYHRRVYSFNAFLSSKASKEVHGMAAKLEPLVHFEMVPSLYIWPRRFGVLDPTDDAIDAYFFPPSVEHERLYDLLALEMAHNEWGMKASLLNSDLLVFSSIELASPFRTFQDKLYLWGVFV